MLIVERQARRGHDGLDWRLLLAPAGLGLLNVGEIGSDAPREIAGDRLSRMVGNSDGDAESVDSDGVHKSNCQRALRDPSCIAWCVVA